MREAERMNLPLVPIGIVTALYLEEGQTTQNHRASLLERFRVMKSHYGLISTLLQHVWFVLRAVLRK